MGSFQLLAAALCALACASGAAAETVANPEWQTRPTATDMERLYPAPARLLSIEGRATISCQPGATGLLENCTVIAETPAGLGFGSAALDLATSFRIKPMLADGRPVVGGVVRIPISFKLPPAPVAPQISTVEVSPRAMELARELTRLSGGGLEKMVEDWINAIEFPGRFQSSGAPTPEQQKAVRDASLTLAGEWEIAKAAQWAKLLSEQELASLVDFAKSAEGAAVIKKSYELRLKLIATQFSALARYQMRAREVFCSKTSCSAYPDLAALERAKVDIAMPRWAATPSEEQIRWAQPQLGLAMQMPGWALLHCTLSTAGSPRDCAVVGESPKGVGFGQAAQGLAAWYVLHPDLMKDGGAGKRVALFISFARPSYSPPPPRMTRFEPQKLALASKLIATQKVKSEPALALMSMAGLTDIMPGPGKGPESRRALTAALGDGEEVAVAEASDMIRTFYAENFTVEELHTLLNLQQTPGARAIEARTQSWPRLQPPWASPSSAR